MMSAVRSATTCFVVSAMLMAPLRALGAEAEVSQDRFSLHAQSTFVLQYHPGFHSGVRGLNSLAPASDGRETFDVTLYGGVRLWRGAEAFANVEVDQGFGVSNTLGAAGYFSGEAYKVGSDAPYLRVPRLFMRQTIDLGGEEEVLLEGANQFASTRSSDNLVVTLGKFSVADIFDTNVYAHDPRTDFLNWSVIDAGAFDYAADAWGYSYGAAAEWTQAWWTLRLGLFNLSRVPNSRFLEKDFDQFEAVTEAEIRSGPVRHPWKIKLLAFANRGHMADYSDAVRLAFATSSTPDVAAVRNYRTRPGFALGLEQHMGDNWGLFLRASINDGSKETYEFTDINKSVSAGASVDGAAWGRVLDRAGVAFVVNGLSTSARRYFGAGGLGVLIGDGSLVRYGTEDILEAYYSAMLFGGIAASIDYQFVAHPAYNQDRGPVSVFGLRLHAQL